MCRSKSVVRFIIYIIVHLLVLIVCVNQLSLHAMKNMKNYRYVFEDSIPLEFESASVGYFFPTFLMNLTPIFTRFKSFDNSEPVLRPLNL